MRLPNENDVKGRGRRRHGMARFIAGAGRFGLSVGPQDGTRAPQLPKKLGRVEAIICSMTPAERRDPSLINGSRRLRIAQGSGTTTTQVNALLKQFKQVQSMMRQMGGGKGKKGKRPKLPIGDIPGLSGR